MSGERGFTLVELLVSMMIGMVILLATFDLLDAGTHSTGRITGRVEADQRARPAMQRMMDELHSACVAPGVQPILAGSTDTSMQLLTQTGAAAVVVPDKHIITLAGGTLTDVTYAATSAATYPAGSSVPAWTFSSVPASSRDLLTGVLSGVTGSPPATTPVFSYYAYVSGQLSSTPLAVPLSPTDAASAAAVTVTFSATPSGAQDDANRAVTLSDSATLRLTAPDENPAATELPCQ